MNCANSQVLWLLLVVPPALGFFFWWSWRVRQKLLAAFIDARLLAGLTSGISPFRQKVRLVLLVVAVTCLIFALARPQWGFDWDKVEQRGLDVIVAVDTSKSMLTTDIAPDRLSRARLAALDLMQLDRGDRLGLVAFAGDAFLECPLTIDDTAFRQSVEALNVNTIPEGGTAIASAITTALAAFKEGDHFKVMVLLTDGEDNVSDAEALDAARDAAKAGLKIFTVGLGTAAGDMIRITDANGNADFVRDPQGDVVKSHLNESLLKQIAGLTGGFYLPLGPETMDTIYERGIAPLPKSEAQEKLVRRYHEQFRWPLAVAIILLVFEMLLPDRKRAAKIAAAVSNAGVAKVAAVALACCLLPHLSVASPASAWRDYNAGNYTNALTEYERLSTISTNDLRLVFNAGTAAYRATNYDEATKLFQTVTVAPDLKLQQQAWYNLGNTQFKMGMDQIGHLMEKPESLDDAEKTWQDATNSFGRAATLDKNDLDSANNLAYTQNVLKMIAQFRLMALRAKAAADKATREAEFHQALEIMSSLVQHKNPLAKSFEDYTKKLKDIDAIVTTNQPPQPPGQP
jgi:Ca-activated chloride channel family protein